MSLRVDCKQVAQEGARISLAWERTDVRGSAEERGKKDDGGREGWR